MSVGHRLTHCTVVYPLDSQMLMYILFQNPETMQYYEKKIIFYCYCYAMVTVYYFNIDIPLDTF